MSKKRIILIILAVVLVLLLIPYRKDWLFDGGSVEYKSVLCKYTNVHKYAENYIGVYVGTKIELLGLKIFDNTKLARASILFACDPRISPKSINDKITEYSADNQKDSSNIAHWGVDETNSKVIVGMIDISNEKQDDFLDSVFEICGTDYIKHIKDNQIIVFKESKGIFTGEIIEFKNDSMLVKILSEEVGSIGSDKVYVQGKDVNSYKVGNKVRITYNGQILTSYPPQVGGSKIELIK